MAKSNLPVQVKIENKTYRMDDVLAAISKDKLFKANSLIVMKTKLDKNYANKLCLAIKDEWLKGSNPICLSCSYGDGSEKSRRFTITAEGELDETDAAEAAAEEQMAQSPEQRQLARLREINDNFEDEEISAAFDRLAASVEKIIDRFDEKPELKVKNKDFYDTYLPKTLAVSEKFLKLCQTGIDSGDTVKIKQEMLDNLKLCEKAFSNVYESSFEEDMLDLSVDIAEIKAKLASDGLTPSDFTL